MASIGEDKKDFYNGSGTYVGSSASKGIRLVLDVTTCDDFYQIIKHQFDIFGRCKEAYKILVDAGYPKNVS